MMLTDRHGDAGRPVPTGRPKLILAGQPGVVTRPSVERWRHEPYGTMVMRRHVPIAVPSRHRSQVTVTAGAAGG
jgi:hypothetical protein